MQEKLEKFTVGAVLLLVFGFMNTLHALSAIFIFTRTPLACTKGRIAHFYFSFGKMKLSVVGLVLVFGLTCVQCSSVDVDKRKESELVTISIPQSILKYIFSTRNLKKLIF